MLRPFRIKTIRVFGEVLVLISLFPQLPLI